MSTINKTLNEIIYHGERRERHSTSAKNLRELRGEL